MARRPRLTTENTVYQSLRSVTPNNTQPLQNILSVGLLAAHLLEREFSVYLKVSQTQEVVVRIYDGEDKYELLIYPYEDAREVIQSSCGRFGGKDDLAVLLSKANLLAEALLSSQDDHKTRTGTKP